MAMFRCNGGGGLKTPDSLKTFTVSVSNRYSGGTSTGGGPWSNYSCNTTCTIPLLGLYKTVDSLSNLTFYDKNGTKFTPASANDISDAYYAVFGAGGSGRDNSHILTFNYTITRTFSM